MLTAQMPAAGLTPSILNSDVKLLLYTYGTRVEFYNWSAGRGEVCTLDLVDLCCGREPALLLLLGTPAQARPWADAAAALRHLPLRTCHILPPTATGGGDGATGGDSSHSKAGATAGGRAPGQDAVPKLPPTFVDASGHWGQVREVSEGGALLVRPDGHVAWRSAGPPPPPQQCAQLLRTAVETVMCL